MLKFLCLLFVFAAAANAAELTVTLNEITISSADNPVVKVLEDGKKHKITWKTGTSSSTNPLKATFNARYLKSGQKESGEIDNICDTSMYKKETLESNFQAFILKVFIDGGKCPFKKGSTMIVPESLSYSFRLDKPMCGEVSAEIKIYKKSAKDESRPLITGLFKGTVTGC